MEVSLNRVEIAKEIQIPVFNLKPSDLDSRGDFEFPRSNGDIQKRGGMEYKQPNSQWIRVGLNVMGKYDDGNNDWLMMDGNPREWAVGFHGSDLKGIKGIIESNYEIRPGSGQFHKGDIDINTLSDNCGKPCGPGSYFADDITISARDYSKVIRERKCVFQVRLCPSKIRIPKGEKGYRIVNEEKYARPYGICIAPPSAADRSGCNIQ